MADETARSFLAKNWGKENTSSDITLYSKGSKNLIHTTVIPQGYPDKPIPLVFTAHMSNVLVLGVPKEGVNADVGESAILADCLGLPGIKAIIGEDTAGLELYFDQMRKLFNKLVVNDWQEHIISTHIESTTALDSLCKLNNGGRNTSEDYLAIEVDHSFPVKGIGSVILGTVISGTVQKGQKIKIYPEGKDGIIKSIQVNDNDEREASVGAHVGIAIKGIHHKFLERGTVISDRSEEVVSYKNNIDIPIKPAAFGDPPSVGDRVHVVAGLFTSPGDIIDWSNTHALIETDKDMPFYPDERITILDLNRKPSVLGSRIISD